MRQATRFFKDINLIFGVPVAYFPKWGIFSWLQSEDIVIETSPPRLSPYIFIDLSPYLRLRTINRFFSLISHHFAKIGHARGLRLRAEVYLFKKGASFISPRAVFGQMSVLSVSQTGYVFIWNGACGTLEGWERPRGACGCRWLRDESLAAWLVSWRDAGDGNGAMLETDPLVTGNARRRGSL